jgi:hypothetical protein
LGEKHTFYIPNICKRYVYIPRYVNTYPTCYPAPFGGLRLISRSGQGLLGQAEEFDEVLAKVLKQELMEGICTKIVDDIYVGGENQEEAVTNYIRILARLQNANLKITPSKTHIFPTSVDVL